MIAIARNTSQPLVEGSSALAFHTGDHIQVEKAAGGSVYVGSVRGTAGSFLAEDVLFYTGRSSHPWGGGIVTPGGTSYVGVRS